VKTFSLSTKNIWIYRQGMKLDKKIKPKKLDLIIKPGQAKGSLAWLDLSQNLSGLAWIGLTQKPIQASQAKPGCAKV
jgi:hypothetical protein